MHFLPLNTAIFSNKAVEATSIQEIKPILLVSGTTIAVDTTTAILQGAKP
jgi:hypothetical protein